MQPFSRRLLSPFAFSSFVHKQPAFTTVSSSIPIYSSNSPSCFKIPHRSISGIGLSSPLAQTNSVFTSKQKPITSFQKRGKNSGLSYDEDVKRMKQQALAYIQKSEHDKAIQILNQLEEFGDPDPFIYWYRGECQLMLGNIPMAHSDIDKAMKLSPGHPGPVTTLANIYIAENKFDSAIEILTMTTDLNGPEFPAAYLALADCYARLEDGAKVVQMLEKYIELSPSDTNVRFRLASIYSRIPIGVSKAIAHVQIVLAQKPDHNEARALYAQLQVHMGEAKEGEKALRKLIETQPNEPLHRIRLASVLLSTKRFREAETILDEAQTIVEASGKPAPPFLKFVESQLAFFYSDFSAALKSLQEYIRAVETMRENEKGDLPPYRAVTMFEAKLYFWRFFQQVQDLSPLKNLLPKQAIVSSHQMEAGIRAVCAKTGNDDLRECFKRVMSLKMNGSSQQPEPVVLEMEEELSSFLSSCQRGRNPIPPVFQADREF